MAKVEVSEGFVEDMTQVYICLLYTSVAEDRLLPNARHHPRHVALGLHHHRRHALRLLAHGGGGVPVSYTHLDVYKRQVVVMEYIQGRALRDEVYERDGSVALAAQW